MLTTTLRDNLNTAAQVALRQWHQAYLFMKLQQVQSDAGPLLSRSLAAHRAGLARRAPSTHFERALAEAVRQLASGHQVTVEYQVPDPDGQGWLNVDVALPGLKLALEADGRSHFLRNVEPVQQTGLTKARDRLLRGWGWHVIPVPLFVWDGLYTNDASHEDLVAGLGRYLVDHTSFKEYIKSA